MTLGDGDHACCAGKKSLIDMIELVSKIFKTSLGAWGSDLGFGVLAFGFWVLDFRFWVAKGSGLNFGMGLPLPATASR